MFETIHHSPQEKHEELIETIGVMLEQGTVTVPALQAADITLPKLQQLADSHHIAIDKDGTIDFLPKGERDFLNIIRRHRLAERLLHDILDFTEEDGSEALICRMEHILTEDFTDSICTLLGHPTVCPHGKKIPPGRCCIQKSDRIKPLTAPLNKLEPGETGSIAFISTSDHTIMDRLASMGLLPGVQVTLKQKRPAIVIQFDQTILSMDEEYAAAVFIRKTGAA